MTVAPDGSPVEVYRRLAPGDEPSIISNALPLGARVLELGCGAGRITRPLVDLGYQVTAVDNSPAMLETIDYAEAVLADIEDLDLGRTFDGVLLGSYFINVPEKTQRRRVLDTCVRHVAEAGALLIQRYPPDFDWTAHSGASSMNGEVLCTLRNVSIDGDSLNAIMEYYVDGRVWSHAFSAQLLSDDDVRNELRRAGLLIERWLDGERSWLLARPLATGSLGREGR